MEGGFGENVDLHVLDALCRPVLDALCRPVAGDLLDGSNDAGNVRYLLVARWFLAVPSPVEGDD
jgi:hypothetical protein